jgi:hypothetical protein
MAASVEVPKKGKNIPISSKVKPTSNFMDANHRYDSMSNSKQTCFVHPYFCNSIDSNLSFFLVLSAGLVFLSILKLLSKLCLRFTK